MLGIVTTPMSQDLHYGDLACMPNNSFEAASDKVRCNATSELEWVQFLAAVYYYAF
jgi:hypothetical protein